MIIGYLLTALFAFFEAFVDYDSVISHRYINHTWEWTQRAVVSATMIALLCAIKVVQCDLDLLLLAIAVPPIFSTVHRYLLNSFRGKKWYYISPSNKYDLFWICLGKYSLTGKLDNPFSHTTQILHRIDHKAYLNNTGSQYYAAIKQGAKYAYSLELFVILSALLLSTFV
jgi:hypothetical protein